MSSFLHRMYFPDIALSNTSRPRYKGNSTSCFNKTWYLEKKKVKLNIFKLQNRNRVSSTCLLLKTWFSKTRSLSLKIGCI